MDDRLDYYLLHISISYMYGVRRAYSHAPILRTCGCCINAMAVCFIKLHKCARNILFWVLFIDASNMCHRTAVTITLWLTSGATAGANRGAEEIFSAWLTTAGLTEDAIAEITATGYTSFENHEWFSLGDEEYLRTLDRLTMRDRKALSRAVSLHPLITALRP